MHLKARSKVIESNIIIFVFLFLHSSTKSATLCQISTRYAIPMWQESCTDCKQDQLGRYTHPRRFTFNTAYHLTYLICVTCVVSATGESTKESDGLLPASRRREVATYGQRVRVLRDSHITRGRGSGRRRRGREGSRAVVRNHGVRGGRASCGGLARRRWMARRRQLARWGLRRTWPTGVGHQCARVGAGGRLAARGRRRVVRVVRSVHRLRWRACLRLRWTAQKLRNSNESRATMMGARRAARSYERSRVM
jgi:hypothetical protein